MSGRRVDRGPSRVGGAIAILAAATAVGLVADASAQRSALAVALGGLVVIVGGVAAKRRDRRLLGGCVKLLGLAAIGTALFLGAVGTIGFTERIELLPGLLGIAILGWGLVPAMEPGSRGRVALGVGLVIAGVLGSGIMQGARSLALLGSVAAAVVAWDAGERAISLGEQVGRDAETASVELVHAVGTATVGGVGMFLALLAYDVNVTDIPLAGLALLLVAALALAIALYVR